MWQATIEVIRAFQGRETNPGRGREVKAGRGVEVGIGWATRVVAMSGDRELFNTLRGAGGSLRSYPTR